MDLYEKRKSDLGVAQTSSLEVVWFQHHLLLDRSPDATGRLKGMVAHIWKQSTRKGQLLKR